MSGFSLSVLQAISDWQRGGNAGQNKRRGEALKDKCATLPEKYHTCSLCCFRQVALPKGGVWKLIGEDCLPEKISSWTLDIEIAKLLKGGVPPEGQGYLAVILCVHPQPSNIVVNLHELYRDPTFREALQQNNALIKDFHTGAGRYRNDQSEIVLELTSVTQADIYSLGGHSSPFHELVDDAAKQIYGHQPTAKQRDALMLKVEHLRHQAGPDWLSPDATQRVLTKLKPHAGKLRGIKQMQQAR